MATQVLGKPCWDPLRIPDVITTIAKMGREQAHHFLASHSPISGIVAERNAEVLTEEDLFKRVFDPTHKEMLAVVWGDPGTGKSHLIH